MPPITFQTSASVAAISKMAPSNEGYRLRPSAALPTNSSSMSGMSRRIMSTPGEDIMEEKGLRHSIPANLIVECIPAAA